MSLNKVSQRVLDAVHARLSNQQTGFNAGLAQRVIDVNLPPFLKVDWAHPSNNFVFGQVNPTLLEQTGIFKYPFVCLYILESGQTGDQRFNQFSGLIRCGLDFYLSWKTITGKYDYETYANVVEDVVIDVINRVENQAWGKPLVYNGGIQCRRSPLEFAAENWRQRVSFSITFGLHE